MKHTRQEKRNMARKLSALFALFAVMCIFAIVILRKIDNQPIKHVESDDENTNLVEIDGKTYLPKKDIETYLFMGIDVEGKVKKAENYGESGQCDTLILLVRDLSEGTYRTLPINRNTMTDVKSLDLEGTYLATTRNQIAYAHAEGDGLEMSCENVVDAVSDLLYGQEIDGYAALNMDAIGIINRLVGGVTVTIDDDFSKADDSLKIGETVTLTDEQAVSYVRGRMAVGDGTNESRIRRQSAYFKALQPILKERCNEDSEFPLAAYDALEEYMVTNISKQKFSKIALLVAKDKSEGELEIKGTSNMGNLDYIEFEPDQDSLIDTVTTLFYKKYE